MKKYNKLTAVGLVVALGIIYGDIGTSPLYVLNAIIRDRIISDELVLGSLSCIFWTLTLQTTIKYVVLTLKADNNGEGGIFSLYALVRKRSRWLVFPAIIGGSALLADGIITPPISVASSIEGLKNLSYTGFMSHEFIELIVLIILALLFFVQQFGTASIGRFFGTVMFVWFAMLSIFGFMQLIHMPGILKAVNPYYAIRLLTDYPKGFWLLGAVFLCTTGAEALYSDLGHCGKQNIRISWIFVKCALILNYFGQGAWLLSNYSGQRISEHFVQKNFNPFYGIIPGWFLLPGIIIATTAAIIASQALISGSFTLISEAIRLNLWPRMRIKYPTEAKGQMFVPGINMLLFAGCTLIVLYFKRSANMEAAYGLAITICMMATTILLANFLFMRKVSALWVYAFIILYGIIETSFLVANLQKFPHGGFITILVAGMLYLIMFVWFRNKMITEKYTQYVKLTDYIEQIRDLSNDDTIPKFATHLVYLTGAKDPLLIEQKIIYSIFNAKPKRADIYWFVHINTMGDPYSSNYIVDHILPQDIIRIDFNLGFRIHPRTSLMMRKVVEDLVRNNEVNIISRYASLEKNKITGDVQFVLLEEYVSQDNILPFWDSVVIRLQLWIKKLALSEEKSFGLESNSVMIEKYPLLLNPVTEINMTRIEKQNNNTI